MTDINERIARGLGYVQCPDHPHDFFPPGTPVPAPGDVAHLDDLPDYEHSLDALLEPLGVLRERGWADWEVATYYRGFEATVTDTDGFSINKVKDTPSEALALAVAEALEAK